MAVAQLNQMGRIPGYPVTKQTAEKIYCGLGKENWWKQLYDGKFHHLGPKVFLTRPCMAFKRNQDFIKARSKRFNMQSLI